MAYTHRDVDDIKLVMDEMAKLKEEYQIVVEATTVRLSSDTIVNINIDSKGYEVEPA